MNRPMRMAASGKMYKWSKNIKWRIIERDTTYTRTGQVWAPNSVGQIYVNTSGAVNYDDSYERMYSNSANTAYSSFGRYTLQSSEGRSLGWADSLVGMYFALQYSNDRGFYGFDPDAPKDRGYGVAQITDYEEYTVDDVLGGIFSWTCNDWALNTYGYTYETVDYVYSPDPNAYPDGGFYGDYYYVKKTT